MKIGSSDNILLYIWGIIVLYLQKLIVKILKCGIIPNHVAFILDGNRRYAKKQNMKTTKGHGHGFTKLKEV